MLARSNKNKCMSRRGKNKPQGSQTLPALHLGARLRVEQEMHAHHVQSHLRSVQADNLSIAGQVNDPLFYSLGGSDGDVHGANGFFFAAAAGSGDARNANSQRAVNAPPDAIGKRYGHFTADGAL